MKINNNENFRVAAMTLRHRGAYFKEYKEYEGTEDAAFREAGEAAAYDAANETTGRFFQSAMLLPEQNFLGWQINTGKNGAHRMFAFFGSGDQVTWNDLDWIFGSYAALEPAPRQFLGEPWGEGRRIYALQYAPYDCHVYQGSSFWGVRDWGDETEMKCEFFASLGEAGASLRITASGTAGTLLLSLPDTMTLRMRTMLSLAFPNTVAVELDNMDDLEDRLDPYPTEYLSSGMIGLLTGMMLTHLKQGGSVHEQAMKHEKEIPPVPEQDADEFMDAFPEEIEDMDFSVRTYNCLRRAGIRTVSQLTELTDEDLHNIRNLGRKSIEEIHKKLARWGYSLKRSDLTVTLDELIGLQNVKEQIRKITALAKMRQDMEAIGKNTLPLVLNMEFVGNPGTAKTTVARILAGIFYEIGLLPSSHLVEVGRADLVAQHVGHTAEKVRDLFRRAKGKVLFIDEAYSLIDDRSGSFGDEAINTIVQEMENNRKDTVVIFAGYPDEMEDFFSRNPGLRSRVPFQINFSDYSADEMVQITELEAAKRGFSIRQSAREKLEGICAAAAQHPDMGNGRFCRNLAESAILGYASRVYGGDAVNVCGYAGEYADAGACRDFELAAEDFTLPEIMQDVKKTVRIGFGA